MSRSHARGLWRRLTRSRGRRCAHRRRCRRPRLVRRTKGDPHGSRISTRRPRAPGPRRSRSPPPRRAGSSPTAVSTRRTSRASTSRRRRPRATTSTRFSRSRRRRRLRRAARRSAAGAGPVGVAWAKKIVANPSRFYVIIGTGPVPERRHRRRAAPRLNVPRGGASSTGLPGIYRREEVSDEGSGIGQESAIGLNPGSATSMGSAGPDGAVWFTDAGTTKAVGKAAPDGTLTEYSAELNSRRMPGTPQTATGGSSMATRSRAPTRRPTHLRQQMPATSSRATSP